MGAAASQALGRVAGLHGTGNGSFRMPDGGSALLLFEADPRPTAWRLACLRPRLGLDWGALMAAANPPPRPMQPQGLPVQGREIHRFPHAPEQAPPTLSWTLARPWILARPWSGNDGAALCVPACSPTPLGGCRVVCCALSTAISACEGLRQRIPNRRKNGLLPIRLRTPPLPHFAVTFLCC
jgi:hypothetical protein